MQAPNTLALDSPREDSIAHVQRFEMVFRDLHDRTWQFLRRMGLDAHEADDAAQDVFLLLARNLRRVNVGDELYYLLAAARKMAAGYRRKRSAREHLKTRLKEAPPHHFSKIENAIEIQLLDKALDALSEELRIVLVMTELEGLERAEIAQLLKIPAGTVASRLRRAREIFEQVLMQLQNEWNSIGGKTP